MLLETALTLLPFMVLVLGLIDVGRAMRVQTTLEHAVREGARYAITYRTSGGCHDTSIKQVVVRNAMGLLVPANITIEYFDGNVNGANLLQALPSSSGNSPDNIVVITARKNLNWIVPLFMSGRTSIGLNASSADRMEALGAGQTPPPRC